MINESQLVQLVDCVDSASHHWHQLWSTLQLILTSAAQFDRKIQAQH